MYKYCLLYTSAEGNIITELLTKGLRATSGTISVPLKNLGRDDAYRIEIQVMNGLDVIDTYMVEKSSDPVDVYKRQY